ncbi:MAG: sigma-70 family RNA polymerase sigma factor [Saprospiraceae bacterium]|nr:sigma-70 family RNA polymerase sigma factor [Saprospiraceae bacterium]
MNRSDDAKSPLLEDLKSQNTRRINRSVLALYDRVKPQVRSFVINNSGNSEDAEDVLQEGLAVLFSKINDDSFEIRQSPSAYLYGICKYVWYKKLSHEKRLPFTELKDYKVAEEMVDVVEEEKISLVTGLMQELSPECQKVLTLFYFDKLSMKDIARKMNYKERNVAKTKKYKCIQALKQRILDHPQYKEILS